MANEIILTQFAELGFMNVVGTNVGYDISGRTRHVNEWRFVDLATGAVVGPYYPSKQLLLSDLIRYATEYGCTSA